MGPHRSLPAWRTSRAPINSWKLTVTHLNATRDDFVIACEVITFSTNGDDAGILPALEGPGGAFSSQLL